jgi:16S rRNA (cytosine1402-N4)-methyltransferase
MLVNTESEENLIRIFRDYSELDHPGRLARHIVNGRKNKQVKTVYEFIELIRPFIPRHGDYKFLAKVFQGLRMAVNAETEALKEMLQQCRQMIRPGGRAVIITYHSLEDRLVKNFFKAGNFEGKVEKDLFGRQSTPFFQVNRKVLTPDEKEISENNRVRSAKMRIGERTDHD